MKKIETAMGLSGVKIIFQEKRMFMYLRRRSVSLT